jgi:Tfp pilus assembly protein PilF
MDCRYCLILGLGLSLAGGGCTPFASSRTTSDSKKEVIDPQVAANIDPAKIRKEKELPRRAPKAGTCLAYGEFRLRESMAPTRTAEDKKSMREEARTAFQQELKLNPGSGRAVRGLAQCYVQDGDHPKAVAAYREALKIAPKEASIWFELGMQQSQHKEWDEAVEALGQAFDLEPGNKRYSNMLGFTLARAGRYEESLAFFTRVVGGAKAHYNVGRMMVHMGKLEEGKQHLATALKMEPGFKEARAEMARLDPPAPSKPAVIRTSFEQK